MIKRLTRAAKFQLLHQKRNVKLAHLKLRTRKRFITKKIQGSLMVLDLKDKGLSTDLLLDGVREPLSTAHVKKIVKKGDVVVDIGANLGYYALMEARMVGPKGKVYCIEPIPSNVETLKKNVARNKYKNMHVEQLAIGDKKAVTKMYVSALSNWSSFVNHQQNITGSIDVQVLPLDGWVKGKRVPQFVRMDVEGYEYQVLKGMKSLLKNKKLKHLFIELHPHLMTKEQTLSVLRTLKNSGFDSTLVVRCLTVTEYKVKKRKDYDYSHKTFDELMNDKKFVSGKLGAFEMFFERNNHNK